MSHPLFARIAVLGLGLIGSSLARDCREKNLCIHIAGFDISPDTLRYAQQSGFIDSAHMNAAEAAAHADLIIFAAPPAHFSGIASAIAHSIKLDAIITDVASVKRQAIDAIAPHIPSHAFFVPAHPIAGSELSGVKAGRADLFDGKRVILTPEERDVLSDPVAQVRTLWEAVGAKITYMPATLHDHIYAYVSHLPQLVACSTWNNLPFSAQNAYGITRLRKSDPNLWADIALANVDFIGEAIEDFIAFGSQIAGELTENQEPSAENAEEVAVLFPKVIASCLIATVSMLEERIGVNPAHYSGSGFADMVAPASSNMEETLAAISQQPQAIARYLHETLATLHRIRQALAAQDRAGFIKLIAP